jgi:arylsulfatase
MSSKTATETKLHSVRYSDWKFLFVNQDKWFRATQDNCTTPIVTNLKLDPFERFDEARGYDEWAENRAWTYGPAFEQVGDLLKSLKDYPPRAAIVDFNVDEAMRSLKPAAGQ